MEKTLTQKLWNVLNSNRNYSSSCSSSNDNNKSKNKNKNNSWYTKAFFSFVFFLCRECTERFPGCCRSLQKNCGLLQSQLKTEERPCWGNLNYLSRNLKQSAQQDGCRGKQWSRGYFNSFQPFHMYGRLDTWFPMARYWSPQRNQ